MSRQLTDLETLLQQLVAEHRKLLGFMDAQQAAMRVFDLNAMDSAVNNQDACRLRIITLQINRRQLVQLLTRGTRVDGPITISRLATMFPHRRDVLLKLGGDLKAIATTISNRSKVSGKLAGAVLGHLNSVVRMLAGAVEKAGVYTKDGIPRVSSRIGIMEAVG
jgi:hypothetical protein